MNPFLFGRVVDTRFYCDRDQAENTLKERLLSGQHMYLSGPRRVGKTSLVERIRETTFNNRSIRVDLMSVKTPNEALAWFIEAWLAYEKDHSSFSKSLEFLSSLNIDLTLLGQRVKINATDKLDQLTFDRILQRLDKRPTRSQPPFLIFFDEFQALLNLDQADRYDFRGVLRKSIQHLKHIRIVYAGSVRSALHEIFQHPDSPFFNSADHLAVGPIEPAHKFRNFLKRKFKQGKRIASPEIWEPIETITGRNPSDMQRLCSAIWETSNEGRTLSPTNVENGLERVFEHQLSTHQMILEQTTALQKRTLVAIAHLGGIGVTTKSFLSEIGSPSSSSVLKAIGYHIKQGTLRKEEKSYLFNNPFLREWLVRYH